MKKSFLLSLIATLLYAPLSFAQEMPTVAKDIPQKVATADDLYCLEQSRGEDIVVDIAPLLLNSVPNTPLTFSGTIQNTSDRLLTGVSVFAQIFRRDEGASDDVLIDQFLVTDGLSIPARGSIPAQFEWMVPAYVKSGAYYVSTSVTVGNRVNDNSEQSTADIMVVGGLSAVAGFDTKTITVNGREYAPGTAVQLGTTEDAVFTAVVVNPEKKAKEIIVVTEVFKNHSHSRQNLTHTESKVYTLPGGGKLPITTTVPAGNLMTTEVVMSAQIDGARSILPMTVVRAIDTYANVRTSALDVFPLMNGGESRLMTCYQAQSKDKNAALSLRLRIEDRNGVVISEQTTPVVTTPQVQGVSRTFESTGNHGYAKLIAEITNLSGAVLDTFVTEYDCSKIEGMKCPQGGAVSTEPLSNGKGMGAYVLIIFALVMALVAVALSMQGMKITKSTPSGSTGGNTNMLSILALLISTSALFGVTAHSAEAKTTSWNSASYNAALMDGIPLCHMYSADNGFGLGLSGDQGCVLSPRYASLSSGASLASPAGLGGYFPQAYFFYWGYTDTLSNAVTTVTYQVDVVNNTTGTPIADGATIPVGTVLRFIPKAFDYQDIRTAADGVLGSGTAYGNWGITGSTGVTVSNLLYTYLPSINYSLYASTQITQPAITIAHGGTATLSCDVTGFICTVTGGGSITSTIRYAATQGELYGALRMHSDPIRQYPDNVFTRILYPVQDPAKLLSAGCEVRPAYSDPFLGFPTIPAGDPKIPDLLDETRERNCASQANTNKFTLAVPQQTIVFNFNVLGAANNVPTPPTITGPNTGTASAVLSFSFTSTDTDNDQLRYGVDWDNNGSVDQWVPGSGYVNSGTSQTVNHSWPTGTYTFQVLAQDTKNGNSTWAPKVVTISAAPIVSGEIFANGTGGATTILAGQQATLSWNSSGVSACTASGVSTGESWTGTSNPGVSTIALFPSFTLPFYSYVLTCDGIALDSVMIFVNPTQCSNWIDDDADGKTDYQDLFGNPSDPGCTSWTDDSEVDVPSSTNLTSEGLTVPGTGTVGSPVNFSATVRNSGTTNVGAFSDRFSYQWGGTGGAWTDLPNIAHAGGLNAGLTAPDNDSYTPLVAGNLYIQHCVDSTWAILEGADETPNCTNNGGSPIVVGAVPPPSTLPCGGTVINGCVLDLTPHGSTDGSCQPVTYSGTCSYTCDDSTWSAPSNNNCIPLPPPSVTGLPTLTTTSRIVKIGTTVPIQWDTNNGNENICTLTGGGLGTAYSPIPLGGVTATEFETGTINQTINGRTTYTLTCPSGSAVLTVDVIPEDGET
jgi:hypothetical protein